MRKLSCFAIAMLLTACSGGGSPTGSVPGVGTSACSNNGQKQFVLDTLYDWYLWNDLLPANIDIADYATPEQLVNRVTAELGPQKSDGTPLDRFSFVRSLEADQEFLGEGRFEGFGFNWRFTDAALTIFRFLRIYPGSPADLGGLERGQQVLSLNGRSVGDIAAAEGINAFFDANDTVDFEIQPLVGAVFTTTVTRDIVTIDPIPQWRVIDAGGGRNVGYMELSTFISTADAEFDTVFAAFRNANVNDVIIDLRYNGGGLVSTMELLADHLGGAVAENLTFSQTEFNADRAAANNSSRAFNLLANSISLSRLVVIATRSTASASEMIPNGMIPHVDVTIVGDTTLGKPVGQSAFEFCEKVLRPSTFRVVNANGDGDYFDGLPVDCPAADDLDIAIGDDQDPNVIAAMTYLNTGACPTTSLAFESAKLVAPEAELVRYDPSTPQREFLGAE